MTDASERPTGSAWQLYVPPVRWLAEYQAKWLPQDAIAGVTLAAYAIPVSLAYATLAGLPPQVGIYGYLLGGVGYALLGGSRQLAIGPTSAISLMIAATVAGMAQGDAQRYAQIASLAGFTVALLCLICWVLRLSALVKLISDSILVGFKAGAGLTIAMTQLPSLFAVPGGGQNFLERGWLFVGQLGQTRPLVLAVGVAAIVLLVVGERLLPGRPVALAIVALSIVVASVLGLPALGVPTTGEIPAGLPTLAGPALRLRDVEGIVPLQELLGLGAANLVAALGHGYPVAGGLSQSAVNDKAGAHSQLALVFASITLALCLLFLTELLENLPKAVLAAVVLTAVAGLVDVPALLRMWRLSRIDFLAAAIALVAVLLLGILDGILTAAAASILLLLARASRPHVAFLGRIPGTEMYSDNARHPENEPIPGVVAFRPEASVVYVNADAVLEAVLARLREVGALGVRLAVCDLSASPFVDLAGARMLHELHRELAAHRIALRIVGARGRVRDLLRADGLGGNVGGLGRGVTLASILAGRETAESEEIEARRV